MTAGTGQNAVVRFAHGGGTCIAAGPGMLLVGPGADRELIAALSVAVTDERGIRGVAAALAAAGMDRLPDVAYAEELPDGDLRLLMRGEIWAIITSADGERDEFHSPDIVTWSEGVVVAPTEVMFSLVDEAADAPEPHTTTGGVVPASRVRRSVGALPPSAARGPDPVQSPAPLPPPPPPPAWSPTTAINPEPEPDQVPAPASEPARSSEGISPDEFDFGHLLGETRFVGAESAAIRPIADDPLEAPDLGLDDAPPPGPVDDPSADALAEPTQNFDPVADEPAPPPRSPGGLIDSVPGVSPSAGAGDRPEPEPEPDRPPPTAAPIAMVPPSSSAPAPSPVPPTDPDPEGDHAETAHEEEEGGEAEYTVALSTLRKARATDAPSGGSQVQAVLCPDGHANPPHAGECRICQVTIADRTIVVVARPALGVLRFDDGTDVVLDRPLILGRKPRGEAINGEEPGLVKLPDPDKLLSRVHAEVRLEEWQVQVIDADSMNHTYVEAPGQPTIQLLPGEPSPIAPGTRVSLGDAVSFVYEVVAT